MSGGSQSQRTRRAYRVFAFAAFSMVVIALVTFFSDLHLPQILERVRTLGRVGPLLFVALHALAVVALLPGMVFPIAAGFLFGFGPGAFCSILGKTLGSTVAFLLARHPLSAGTVPERARRALRRHPKFQVLDEKLPEGGWQTVALIRLVPLIPFKLSNYLFGWTKFSLRDFVLGTVLGVVPYSITNAFLGSLAVRLTDRQPDPGTLEIEPWLYVVIGLVATAAAVAVAQRALQILRRTACDH